MDVLRENLPGGPPQPLPMTDYQSMEEQLKVKDQISVVHFPQSPPGFQRCSNTLNIIKMEGASWSLALMLVISVTSWSCVLYMCVHVWLCRVSGCMSSHLPGTRTDPWVTENSHYLQTGTTG